MSVCVLPVPYVPGAVRTVRCPYVPYVPRTVRTVRCPYAIGQREHLGRRRARAEGELGHKARGALGQWEH